MKNLWTLFCLLPCLTGTGFAKTGKAATIKAATRYYDSTKLLDFSDSSKNEVDDYYGDISDRKGDELLRYLYARISCPSEDLDKYYLDYGSGLKGVGQWYQVTDRNWKISEEVTPETFTFITRNTDTRCKNTYFYSMYISDEANNDPKKAVNNFLNGYSKDTSLDHVDYTNRKKPNSYIQIDKEHVWAKNHGFKVKDSSGKDTFQKGAPTDLHHLIAADHNTNSAGHNDYFYGDVDHDSATKIYAYLADGSKELSGYLDTSGETFEPTDEWKGDIARSLFYMATRYSVKKNQNTQGEPYLKLTDDRSYSDDSNVTFHGVQYNLTTLLEWNEKDPVSEYEYHRNNLIYKNVQNNRNPYVDHPEWARLVFAPDTISDSIFQSIDGKTYQGRVGNQISLDLDLEGKTDYVTEYDSSYLSIDKNVVTLKKEGSTSLTFKETVNDKTTSYTCVFDILSAPTLDKVQIDNSKVTIDKDNNITATEGDSFQLGTSFKNLLPNEGICYETSDTNIAEISLTGLVKPKKEGTCYINLYLDEPSTKQARKEADRTPERAPLYQIKLTVNKKKSIIEIDENGNFSIFGLSSRMSYVILIVIAVILLLVIILIIVLLVTSSEKKKKKTSMKKASRKRKK